MVKFLFLFYPLLINKNEIIKRSFMAPMGNKFASNYFEKDHPLF
jgi:hypothetical protein